MSKRDLKRELSDLYSAPREPVLVDVPDLRFAMVDGRGDPNTAAEYAAAVQGLYSVSYAAKFLVKKATPALDYVVMPLEGLWWADDPSAFTHADKAAWLWTMMIAQPDAVTEDDFEAARSKAASTAREEGVATAVRHIRLERFGEGRAAQVLHVGPYSAEGPTVARLHAFIAAQGCALAGRHHEIYLGDPRRTAPERLRTIVRQPVTC
jgi:hypothetical protein